ncbi:hypothetical protein TGAM01_v200212 [Trichoderma gamsii]|uniref:Uncharacterized protein n=1 Tax=Trichoderma gamsii TaxID=398673 RepID=A0A2P5A2N5_9HYPO|nr:hypothetical protein TGAM01_v200212 [Trichoderma gamsii]PON30792.1 hypothetical protein TGAM01_v200212 [Trichoderma gamsii]
MAANDASACEGPVWWTISANKDNMTALQTIDAPPWVSAPQFRGTMAILQSCILTLVACIYTAIHLNVPVKVDWLSLLVAKAWWILIALFAPEIVLFSAASQFRDAWKLRNALRALHDESKTADKEFKFTLSYAFFVVMGGVHIERSRIARFLSRQGIDKGFTLDGTAGDVRDELLFSEDSRATLPLKPQGVLDLCRFGCWVYVSKSKIDARSKANQIQKALVLLQVSWMVLQCIARRAYGLPLALLEVHIMVHVVCAVLLYLFWFEKPLDVRAPEIVYDPSWDSALALVVQKTMYDDQLRRLRRYHIPEGVQLVIPTHIYPGPNGAARAIRDRARALGQQLNSPIMTLAVSAKDEELSPEALNRFRAINDLFESVHGKSTNDDDVDLCQWIFGIPLNDIHNKEHGFTRQAKNLSFAFFKFSVDLQELFQVTQWAPGLLVLALAMPLAYGGIHLSVWNFEFPSGTERLLWRIASIGIAATSLVLFAVGLGMKILLELVKALVEIVSGRRQSRRQWREVGESIYPCMGALAVLFYALARVYIVVESFVSLRHVPIGVYLTPSWLQMMPHV